MKKSLSILIILLIGIIINFSCTKTGMNRFPDSQLSSNAKVIPNVPQCGPGQHWSYYLNKCVDVCSSGYHNDSITGACVIDGGGGGGIGPNRICGED